MKIFKTGDYSFLNPKDVIETVEKIDENKTRIKLTNNSIFIADQDIESIIRDLLFCNLNLIEVQHKHYPSKVFVNVKNIIYIEDIEGHTKIELKGGNQKLSCFDSIESLMYKLKYIH